MVAGWRLRFQLPSNADTPQISRKGADTPYRVGCVVERPGGDFRLLLSIDETTERWRIEGSFPFILKTLNPTG